MDRPKTTERTLGPAVHAEVNLRPSAVAVLGRPHPGPGLRRVLPGEGRVYPGRVARTRSVSVRT